MSYSYIQSVFPNFEKSKVYDSTLYNNNKTPHLDSNVLNVNDTDNDTDVSADSNYGKIPIKTSENTFDITLTETKIPIEGFTSTNTTTEVDAQKNNTQYYNLPIINNHIPNYNNINHNQPHAQQHTQQHTQQHNQHRTLKSFLPIIQQKELQVNVENFTPNVSDFKNTADTSHDEYVSHVIGCTKCKDALTKQFNLNIDKIKYEETLEITSYIVFGLFILILLDCIKK